MIDFYQSHLETLAGSGRLRSFKPLSNRQGCWVEYKGRTMLNLSSNDYLGLAGNLELQEEFYGQLHGTNLLDRYGLGAASSRLLAGDNEVSHELETLLRESYRKEACLLFNSGYHANIGILPALVQKGDLILSDKLNHASITDGLQLCRGSYKRYHHCDYDHLKWLLEKYRQEYKRTVIVSESVFSMDGDVVDLSELVTLKQRYKTLLYIDEAHSVGLYGEHGLGIAEAQGLLEEVDLLIGTFGKAPASIGAFLLCSRVFKDFLINTSRSLIFTTALPPVVTNWNIFALKKIQGYRKQRKHLLALSGSLRKDLKKNGLKTDGTTNIVPVMLGEDALAVRLSEKMQQLGYLIFPVRPPTVPEGTSRFRLSLTADMTWQDLAPIASTISGLLSSKTAG